MLLIVAVMVLTPSVVSSTTSQAINATDVIVAVDTTGSMAVADATYGSEKTITRIDAARQAVHDVTAAYPDASFAALRFGASGTLDVPLTPDAPAIDNWPTRWRWKPHPCRRAPVWMLRSINCC